MQVFSKNCIFNSSSMVVNLTEDLTEADFIGRLRGLAFGGKQLIFYKLKKAISIGCFFLFTK